MNQFLAISQFLEFDLFEGENEGHVQPYFLIGRFDRLPNRLDGKRFRIGEQENRLTQKNAQICCQIIERAAKAGAKCVFLPEASDYIAASAEESRQLAASADCGTFVETVRNAARSNAVEVNIGIHGFSEKTGKITNQLHWIDKAGKLLETYTKLHLFDVHIKDGPILKESDSIEAGYAITPPIVTQCGMVGMAICFDMRFPELSLRLRRLGAEVIVYPSAFSVRTGAAHWDILLRARAIENSCYVVAAAQVGNHNEKRCSYGHAMVVDPWGTVISQVPDINNYEPRFSLAEIDLDLLKHVREAMPLIRRTDVYPEI